MIRNNRDCETKFWNHSINSYRGYEIYCEHMLKGNISNSPILMKLIWGIDTEKIFDTYFFILDIIHIEEMIVLLKIEGWTIRFLDYLRYWKA